MTDHIRGRRRAAGVAAAAVLAVAGIGAGLADAAGGNWVHSVAPRNHHVYHVGDRIHFKVRAHGVGRHFHVYARVSTSRKTRHGVLSRATHRGDFFSFHRHRHGRYTYTPPHYTFPSWYMQHPGRYYWQAQFADASCPHVTCHSRIRSFRVR